MASREKRKHAKFILGQINFSGERALSYLTLFSYLLLFAPSPLSDFLEKVLIGIGFEPFYDEIPRGTLCEWKTE